MNGAIARPASTKLNADALSVKGARIFGGYLADGKITPALSPRKVGGNLPAGVFYATVLQPSGRLAVCAEDGFYYSSDGENFTKSDSGFTAKSPFAFYPDGGKTCIVGDGECLVSTESLNVKKDFNGNIYGGVFKNGRLFGIDRDNPYKIRWSCEGGLDFTESGGAGWVEITAVKGEILNLIVYKQKIIALCRYGLVALSAFGLPENFKLQYIDGAIGGIFKNTAAIAGGKLVFLTADGLRSFDGVNVGKVEVPLVSDVESPACALGFGGEYFISAYSKALERKVVFVFDINKAAGCIIDLEAAVLVPFGGVRCISDKGCFALVKGGGFTFESGEITFNSNREKVLKSIVADCAEGVDITVESCGKSRIFAGVRGILHPIMRGKSFKITVRGKCEINGLSAVAEVWNGI